MLPPYFALTVVFITFDNDNNNPGQNEDRATNRTNDDFECFSKIMNFGLN
jgi:hypothetical protein